MNLLVSVLPALLLSVGFVAGSQTGPKTAVLWGVVVRSDGKPVPAGTQVQLFAVGEDSQPHFAYTDSRGCFRASALRVDSRYEIEVELGEGKKTKRIGIEVVAARHEITVRLASLDTVFGGSCGQAAQAPTANAQAGRTAPRLIHRVRPEYSNEARQRGLQGKVVLMLAVESDGTVAEIRGQSGNAILVEAAARSVRHWRYEPARRADRPVRAAIIEELNFSL